MASTPSVLDDLREMAKGWRWGRRPMVPRSAEPYRGELPSDEFPTDWARSRPMKAARAVFHRFVLKPVTFNEVDVEVLGLENLDLVDGPVIFFSNHSSHLDASLLVSSLPPEWRAKVAVGAAKDYFFDKWWFSIATAFVYNAFPVDRARGRGTISTARRLLDEDYSLIVFPEGTRSRDGWMSRFRHGAARLAVDAQVQVVPIGIRGANAAMPTGRSWPKPGRLPVNIRFGPALTPEEGEDHRSLSRRMTQSVAQLLDEDRTTWFEAAQRASRDETPIPRGPDGPKWLRMWEGTKPIARRGGKGAWPR